MIDPLNNISYGQDIDPIELQNTLAGFLGQTYQEITRYDSNIVSPNAFLAPKKEEFHRTAEKVFQEVKQASGNIALPQQPQPYNQVVRNVQNNTQPTTEIFNDPNQLEFCFDNSVTAISIDKKLTDIEKTLKRLDSLMQKMVSLLDDGDIKNKK